VADEIPTANDPATPPNEDAEFAQMFEAAAAQAGTPAGGGDDMWDTDWSPDQGLHPEGWHQAVLANVDKAQTRAGDPAIDWAVTILETGRTLKRKVNLKGGSGIERFNVQFASAFGVEPVETPAGRQMPGGQLRKHIGDKVEVKIEHRKHWAEENRMVEDITAMRPVQTGGVDLG
jgi:hypothetical protein